MGKYFFNKMFVKFLKDLVTTKHMYNYYGIEQLLNYYFDFHWYTNRLYLSLN